MGEKNLCKYHNGGFERGEKGRIVIAQWQEAMRFFCDLNIVPHGGEDDRKTTVRHRVVAEKKELRSFSAKSDET